MPPKKFKSPPKNYAFILILGISGLIVLYTLTFPEKKNAKYSSDPAQTLSNHSATNYAVTNIDLNNKRAFNVVVRIREKLPEYQLEALAKTVKSDIQAQSEQGVIFFRLPETDPNGSAWASVTFQPEIHVAIMGKSISDENTIQMQLPDIDASVGLWMDDDSPGDVLIRIRKDQKEGYLFEYISARNPKPSELATHLVKTRINGKTVFQDSELVDEYFVLESNGDLSAYDNNGFVVTWKKLK